jgi:hypothetical protein
MAACNGPLTVVGNDGAEVPGGGGTRRWHRGCGEDSTTAWAPERSTTARIIGNFGSLTA